MSRMPQWTRSSNHFWWTSCSNADLNEQNVQLINLMKKGTNYSWIKVILRSASMIVKNKNLRSHVTWKIFREKGLAWLVDYLEKIDLTNAKELISRDIFKAVLQHVRGLLHLTSGFIFVEWIYLKKNSGRFVKKCKIKSSLE